MALCYNKLWKLLIDKKMKKGDLRIATGISTSVLAQLGKDEPVSIRTLQKICLALNCDIGDIVEIIAE